MSITYEHAHWFPEMAEVARREDVEAEFARLTDALRAAEERIGWLARFATDDAKESRDDLAERVLSRVGLIEWRVKEADSWTMDGVPPDWWHDIDVGDRYWCVTDECHRLMGLVDWETLDGR